MKLGIDIGSVSAKLVVLDGDRIIDARYVRTKGQPLETALALLEDVLAKYQPNQFDIAGATGTGGKLIAELLAINFVNEIIAQSRGLARFHPEVQSIIEIGGEDSKLIILARDGESRGPNVVDFAINGVCAAGTGSFLDQQASRMGIPIEEFGEVALQSVSPPRIAGRCSVFAKTDMIHLQQIGTPVKDIVAGLCFAMVRNFMGNVVRGRQINKPVSLQGGVAANKGIKRAILEVMQLKETELIIPEHYAVLGALGAVIQSTVETQSNRRSERPLVGAATRIRDYLSRRTYEFVSLPSLKDDNYEINVAPVEITSTEKVEAYVGVDVGSISTNVVVIDKDCNVLARRYLMTASKPIEAVKHGLYEVNQVLGDRVVIKGAGSTGSGRYMTGEFFGADVIRNEITSHAKAAAFMCPEADTIFEIGGQDAKYISLKNGAIVDFAMNKVCAAGTGSFLEEQAEKLDIKIDQQFGAMALSSQQPLDQGERCTVFIESQLNYHKQKGAPREDLVSGLAYSVVRNYLSKVVEDRHIGDHILFQGGVAFNRGVKAAFENVTGKKIQVPPHHDVLGAVGVAMLAMEEMQSRGGESRFKGFDLRNRKYELSSFECGDCANLCEIHKVIFDTEEPLYYGSRCGKYDSSEKKRQMKAVRIPRLFNERQRTLMHTYDKDVPDWPNGKTIGIPRALFFHELFPLWKAFFTELGFKVVVSEPTSTPIIRKGVENVIEEPCLPIKVAFGHVLSLLEKPLDFVFLPVQCTMEKLTDDFSKSWNCPLTQSLPFIINSCSEFEQFQAKFGDRVKFLRPVFHPDRGREWTRKVLRGLARELGISSSFVTDKAIKMGFQAFDDFNSWQQKRGQEVLDSLKPEDRAVVIVGRAYNTCDAGMTLDLPEKLRDLSVLAIPVDFLPLKSVAKEVTSVHPNMYWKAGQKILAAATIIASDPRLFGLYLTNFNCGPDSYLMKFFSKETEGKPFLTIEIDEHSADVGIMTRCEAFIDTIRNAKTRGVRTSLEVFSFVAGHTSGRKIYIPYMVDHGYIVAAAMRHCGAEAEALPLSDQQTLELGRKHTSGKECFPSIITTGDFVKKTLAQDFDPAKAAFFMPGASGPCRFGQYNMLHRIVLDELGLKRVPMLVFDQTKDYHDHMTALGRDFRLLTWRACTILDAVHKLVLEKRPFEVNKGETDAAYQHWLNSLVNRVDREGNHFKSFAYEVRDGFEGIKLDKSELKPRIGIVGEIFVRSNPFANEFIIRKLEALGAQCALPPFEEWLDYIDYQRQRRAKLRLEGDWLDLLKQKLTAFVQERTAESLRQPFDDVIENFARELPTPAIMSRGCQYLSREIEGEAILSMGRAVEYAEHGFNGIVNVIPFGCMPGTVTSMLLHQFRQEHRLPVFNLVVDGSRNTSLDIRLEAFYHQCLEHMRRQTLSGRTEGISVS